MAAQTAAEAFDRYKAAFDADLLIQREWHKEIDGRQLVCALSVLGEDVNGASDCPAAIMPRWLAQMVPWFFDSQNFSDAKAWGLRFYDELQRLNGIVPFSVIHDWHARFVGPLAIEVATKRNRNVEAHKALMSIQAEASTGKKFSVDEWKAVLRPAFHDADAYAYAYANAYAYADAYAYAYAYANADAYVYVYAYAYAYAYANADAYVYADADAKQMAIKQLADGMVDCLSRIQPSPLSTNN